MGMEGFLLTAGLVGMGIQAYGNYREGMDAAEASRYNADISRQSAEMTERAGALDAMRQRKQVSRALGTQKAQYGARGVEWTGSPLNVMIESATEGELDAQIIEYNSKVKAAGYMSQASYDERLADIYRRSGLYKAGSTILTQGANIGLNYYGGYNTGALKSSDGIKGQVYQGGKVKTGDYSYIGSY